MNHSNEAIAGEVSAEKPLEETAASPNPAQEQEQAKADKWTRVRRIRLSNFKAIEDATIPLGNVTILVGPNGSGKSSALQAIHWAVRAASYIAPKNGKETIAFERIDYLPSSEPIRTAFRSELKSNRSTKPTTVQFIQDSTAGDDLQDVGATIQIYAARNGNAITAHIEGKAAVAPFKQRTQFLTAYIPGLAGLSERETILAQPTLRRQAASGDAGSVLRNILYNIKQRSNDDLAALNRFLGQVHLGAEVEVEFDEREDVHIRVWYNDTLLSAEKRSLENAATGVLQVLQIFAYLILFRPKLLLIDEPDAHLHPDKQERLIEALESAAAEYETQILLTTHSQHVVRAASLDAKFIWMEAGKVRQSEDSEIRRMMGWGAIDKELLFFVEDEDEGPIKAILRQWPDLNRRLAVCRCFGLGNLPRNDTFRDLLGNGTIKAKILVQRDRDFMTDNEVEKWCKKFSTEGINAFVTPFVDIEAYFCASEYLKKLFGVDSAVADKWIATAAANVTKAKDTFEKKRKEINATIYGDRGGQPVTDDLWQKVSDLPGQRVLGKKLIAALKPVIKEAKFDEKKLDKFEIPTDFVIGAELKDAIISALKKN